MKAATILLATVFSLSVLRPARANTYGSVEPIPSPAAETGVEYTPIVNGEPSLFQGGAAFPGNNWTMNPRGEAYLARIPRPSHKALARIRDFHLRVVREVLRNLGRDHGRDDDDDGGGDDRRDDVTQFNCR